MQEMGLKYIFYLWTLLCPSPPHTLTQTKVTPLGNRAVSVRKLVIWRPWYNCSHQSKRNLNTPQWVTPRSFVCCPVQFTVHACVNKVACWGGSFRLLFIMRICHRSRCCCCTDATRSLHAHTEYAGTAARRCVSWFRGGDHHWEN